MTLHQSVLSEGPKFAPREIRIEKRPDGTLVLRSPIAFETPQWSILDFIPQWAEKAPQRVFLAQRGRDGEWQKLSYAELWQRVQSVGQAMIDLGAKRGDRLAILSGNSIEHAIVMFAAMSVGIVAASISPNYSLMPGGLARLQDIATLLQPSFVFVQDSEVYSGARKIPELSSATWIAADQRVRSRLASVALPDAARRGIRAGLSIDRQGGRRKDPVHLGFDGAAEGRDQHAQDDGKCVADGDVAGIASRGTGAGRMASLASHDGKQRHPARHFEAWRYALYRRGASGPATVSQDDCQFEGCIADRHVQRAGRIHAVVRSPGNRSGFADQLFPATRPDELRRRRDIADHARQTLSVGERRNRQAHSGDVGLRYHRNGSHDRHHALGNRHAGRVGTSGSGVELKLIPAGDTYEARVRGPNVTPGYLGRPDLTSAAFDDEGFYRVGDTISFIDPANPGRGLCFTGRVSENFKLANGTWVAVGNLRAALLAATHGVLQDIVIAGENRHACAVLGWLNPVMARKHATNPDGNPQLRPGRGRLSPASFSGFTMPVLEAASASARYPA